MWEHGSATLLTTLTGGGNDDGKEEEEQEGCGVGIEFVSDGTDRVLTWDNGGIAALSPFYSGVVVGGGGGVGGGTSWSYGNIGMGGGKGSEGYASSPPRSYPGEKKSPWRFEAAAEAAV